MSGHLNHSNYNLLEFSLFRQYFLIVLTLPLIQQSQLKLFRIYLTISCTRLHVYAILSWKYNARRTAVKLPKTF